MNKFTHYLGQAVLYGLFFVPLAYLTSNPLHTQQEAGMATLKVAVRHAGKIVGECKPVDSEQYARMPANMKRPEICPRERSPLRLAVELDGEILYAEVVPAAGLHSDGVASVYMRFEVPAGKHRLRLGMNDDVAVEGDTWEFDQEVTLAAAQVVVARFKEGFIIR
jgi:hypothetical protein